MLAAVCWLGTRPDVPVQADMVIQGYDSNRHDRFDDDRMGTDFIGSAAETGFSADLDFSGVGRAANRWVTMISPTHFVTARHAQPSGTVNFYTGNDPSSTPITCTIVGGTPIGTTDIWVGSVQIDANCDTSSIAHYEIALPDSYIGETVYQAGDSNQSFGSDTTTNMRVGRNKLTEVLVDAEIIGRTGDWAVFADDSVAGDVEAPFEATVDDFNPDETQYRGGDSGGPSFLVANDGSMQLLGIHSWRDDPDLAMGEMPLLDGRLSSGDAYLPSHRTAILAAAAVPEPSPLLCISVVALFLSATGRLRRCK